jgi:hypothetical protein
MKRWTPPVALSPKEQFLMKRLSRTKKLFAFLRSHRHELFDDAFQEELEGMYRKTGAGAEPLPPALLCMVLLLQAYTGISDAEAVELTVVDARWQLVLDCMGAERPAISQGSLQSFRERLIISGLDRRLLERTVELAKDSKEFDWKKLPKQVRLAVDSRPLEGAGRVEDTINLLGHAARKIAALAATLTGLSLEAIAREARIPILLYGSTKAALDRDWNDPSQRGQALDELLTQIDSFQRWIEQRRLDEEQPLQRYIAAISQIRKQDTEQGPTGKVRLKQGVAEDRRISIEEPEMRHGRKSKSKRFNGYKQHVATDLDTSLILACAVTPANRPEEQATPQLQEDLDHQKVAVGRLYVDRGYLNSPMVQDVENRGRDVVCKPWRLRNSRPGLFTQAAFKLNMRDMTVTCPAGHVEGFEPGDVIEFDPEACGPCPLRAQCTHSASGKGRTISIAEDEVLQKKLRALQSSAAGRRQLRERVGVEHRLAHIAARQGPRARYRGVSKNLFDLRRAASIQNLETIHRRKTAA